MTLNCSAVGSAAEAGLPSCAASIIADLDAEWAFDLTGEEFPSDYTGCFDDTAAITDRVVA